MSGPSLVLVPLYPVRGRWSGASVNHCRCFPVLKHQSAEWVAGKAAGSSAQLVFVTLPPVSGETLSFDLGFTEELTIRLTQALPVGDWMSQL